MTRPLVLTLAILVALTFTSALSATDDDVIVPEDPEDLAVLSLVEDGDDHSELTLATTKKANTADGTKKAKQATKVHKKNARFPIDAEAWLQNHHPLGLMQKSTNATHEYAQFLEQLWKSSLQNPGQDHAVIVKFRHLVSTDSVVRMLLNQLVEESNTLLQSWQNEEHRVRMFRKLLPGAPGMDSQGSKDWKLAKKVDGRLTLLNGLLTMAPLVAKNVDGLLTLLNAVLTMAPLPSSPHNYFLTFPMCGVVMWMSSTKAGLSAFMHPKINNMIRELLNAWSVYLASPASAYVLTKQAWLADPAIDFSQFKHDPSKPHWGWRSWNDFFTRTLVPGVRPIAPASNAIVSAVDCSVWHMHFELKRKDKFWVKQQRYSLEDMLDHHTHLIEPLVGGTLFQAFLGPTDYHRWHAPVSGTIIAAGVIEGLYYAEGFAPQFDLELNTRGIVAIQTELYGVVVLMPVGIGDVSSIVLAVKEGNQVTMGQELGMFQFGGSTVVTLTQRGVITAFTGKAGDKIKAKDKLKMGQQIALMHQVQG